MIKKNIKMIENFIAKNIKLDIMRMGEVNRWKNYLLENN